MPTCDYCGIKFDLFNGIYDDGDFMCGSCIAGFIIQSEDTENKSRGQLKTHSSGKTKKLNKCKPITPSHSSQINKEQNPSKLNKKAANFVKNIQIMLKSQNGGLCINSSNKKAFELAVEHLGMRLDEFYIENDGFYLNISLKHNIKQEFKIVPILLKRPELPKNNTDLL